MLLCILLVPILAILHHPLIKRLSDFGVDDIADVLSWHLADLLWDGEAVLDVLVSEAKVEDGVQCKAIVMRDGNVVDLVPIDGL